MEEGITRRDSLAGVATALLARVPADARADVPPTGNVAANLRQLRDAPTERITMLWDGVPFRWETRDAPYRSDEDKPFITTVTSSRVSATVGAWVRQTAASITAHDDRFEHAPALSLRNWLEGGVVNAKQQALPPGFDHATDDAWPYLQQLVADVEKLGERNAILLPTADLYRISRPLILGRATGLMGLGPAKPIISYVGDVMNPATQDDFSGAMITWKGTDHAWGGIKDVALFANRRAVHCLYVEGDITPGFKISDVHGQHALLDIVSVTTAGTSSSPVSMIIQALTAYPFVKDGFAGVSAVCGRSVLRFRLNGSVGSVTLRDANLDNGALGFIDIDCLGDLAGIDYLFDNCRFEQNQSNGDIVTLRYGDAASEPGTLTFRNCKHAHGVAGARTSAFVRNRTRFSSRRPDIGFDPFLSNEAVESIYADAYDSGKTVPYVLAEHSRRTFRIEHSCAPVRGTFPSIARPIGLLPPVNAANGTAVTVHDHDKLFTNLGAEAPCSFRLPPLAQVAVGFRVRFSAQSGYPMTVKPSGSDKINGLPGLTSQATRDALTVEKSGLGEWTVLASIGSWN